MSLLEVENLSVKFKTNDGIVSAVNDVSFSMDAGKTLAIVGESGSGKSQTAFSILGLLAPNGLSTGSVKFDGQEILNAPLKELNKVRAEEIAIVFQDPMTSLNPYMRVSEQMAEVLIHHQGISKAEAFNQSVAMLDAVKIPDAKRRARLYPHEFSGGMRQRVMIAMSLLCRPKLLIADEPTTALDVTVQAQIMDLFSDIQKEFGMGVILITHDLGVVAGFCEDVLVLYGGRVMEQGPVDPVFENPSHPYTQGLLRAIPRIDQKSDVLDTIPGTPPNMLLPPKGCPFVARCKHADDICGDQLPDLCELTAGRLRACHQPMEKLV
ncbi:oligopeptide transporter ATP-binding component [Kiloniella litopenaei]|uniref:Oligopeptide transporter ATP-binding component n=1 Tax=Kiloniella litopenaei TaxID=1549748 RepID=A0A0M2R8D2_9PROT|nr:oligopeptide/dipeptide ABC transporter ATP-binding protein [Kiloniella litopenaei]KKJ76679.1 oligopeptide transporter ATP-binding component [Kiloniella litopenaei]